MRNKLYPVFAISYKHELQDHGVRRSWPIKDHFWMASDGTQGGSLFTKPE